MGTGESRSGTNLPTVQVPSNSKAVLMHLGSTGESQTATSPPSCSLEILSMKSRMSTHTDEPTTFVRPTQFIEDSEYFE